jgi:hypothetical protein
MRYAKHNNIEVQELFGFNAFPLFYKPFFSILNMADEWGHNKILGPRMVNIAFKGVKRT